MKAYSPPRSGSSSLNGLPPKYDDPEFLNATAGIRTLPSLVALMPPQFAAFPICEVSLCRGRLAFPAEQQLPHIFLPDTKAHADPQEQKGPNSLCRSTRITALVGHLLRHQKTIVHFPTSKPAARTARYRDIGVSPWRSIFMRSASLNVPGSSNAIQRISEYSTRGNGFRPRFR